MSYRESDGFASETGADQAADAGFWLDDTEEAQGRARDFRDDEERPAGPPVQVFLTRRREGFDRGLVAFPGLLCRVAALLHLDKYGASLLTPGASRAMGYGALAIVIAVVFEWGAWTILLNYLLNGAPFVMNGRTAGGAAVSALYAAAALLFERSIYVADTSERGLRVFVAYAVRLAFLTASAAITAHAMDLVVFDTSIRNRVHIEGALHEVVGRLPDLDRARAAAADQTEKSVQTEITARLASPENAAFVEKRNAAKAAREQTAGEYDRSVRLLRALRWSRFVSLESLRAQTAALQTALEEKRTAEADAERELAERRDEVARAVISDSRTVKATAAADAVRLEKWIALVWDSKPGATLDGVEMGDAALRYEDPVYAAGDLDRILDDLCEGRAPRLPPSTTEADKARLATEFRIRAAEGDAEEARRLTIKSWMALAAALFLPLIVFVVKLLPEPELRAYYSARAQLRAGNADLHEIAEVEGRPTETARGRGGRR